jgi:hypothetical protein
VAVGWSVEGYWVWLRSGRIHVNGRNTAPRGGSSWARTTSSSTAWAPSPPARSPWLTRIAVSALRAAS